jgi:hypothetical protein
MLITIDLKCVGFKNEKLRRMGQNEIFAELNGCHYRKFGNHWFMVHHHSCYFTRCECVWFLPVKMCLGDGRHFSTPFIILVK